MTPFELVEPATLGEALALLDPDDPDVRPIAGGTALILMMKSGLYRPQRLVSLRVLGPAISSVTETPEGGLEIGAMVRLSEIERSGVVGRIVPVIADTLLTHSNVRVRNVATIGGNLAHADPHMDLPPVLIALGASVRAVRPGGERTIPAEDLFSGYMATVLANNELIMSLQIPPQAGRRAAYAKVTARSADDWPALGIAVSVGIVDGMVRLPGTEALLAGRRINAALLQEAGKAAASEAPVVSDLQGSASYKRVLVEVHLRRALQRALAA